MAPGPAAGYGTVMNVEMLNNGGWEPFTGATATPIGLREYEVPVYDPKPLPYPPAALRQMTLRIGGRVSTVVRPVEVDTGPSGTRALLVVQV